MDTRRRAKRHAAERFPLHAQINSTRMVQDVAEGGPLHARPKARAQTALSLLPVPRRGANPYLDGLYRALSRQGIHVIEDHGFSWYALRGQRPDFVHYHWPENLYGHHLPFRQLDRAAWFFSKLALQRALGARIVWTFHNAVPHEAPWPKLHAWARRRMVAMSDIILIHFESARTELGTRYGRNERVWHMPHGSYRGLYPDTITRGEARERLGLPEDARVFLLFGDLRKYKNAERAISAFRDLEDPRARLIIAGQPRRPDDAAHLAKLCRDDPRIVLRAQRIAPDEVQTYFRAADLLLLPRQAFSSGTAVLAFDFGLPILAPRAHHIAELATGSACFDLHDLSIAGLTRAMRDLLATDLTQARVDAALSTEHLAWEGIAERLAHKLLATRDGPALHG